MICIYNNKVIIYNCQCKFSLFMLKCSVGEFMDIFNEHGLKRTKTREIILEKLKELNRPISSEELHSTIVSDYSINLATVYRNLNTLVDINVIEKIVRQDGVSYYSFMKNGHSHYMVCDICNVNLKLESCPINIDTIIKTQNNGFKTTGHILEIHGICKKCQIGENKKETGSW